LIAEFPEIAVEDENGDRDVEFDIVVGNPPYGDILGEAEKILTDDFTTSSVNDISALFVERQLRLRRPWERSGTSQRFVLSTSPACKTSMTSFVIGSARWILRASRTDRNRCSPNAIVRVAILTGQQTNPDDSGLIRTSKFLQFNKENRKEVFDSIEFRSVEGLELREQIGGDDRSYEVLPKVGWGDREPT